MKKILAFLLALLLMLSFAACGGTEPADEPKTITGSGTEEDPWQIGATENDSVTAYLDEDNWLTVDGEGAMMDFESEEDRPWNDAVSDIENLSIFADLSRIGKNAFKGIGKNADWFSYYFGTVTVFGESCFEDANLGGNILTLEETVEGVEANAFANCGVDEIHLYCAPTAIADSAFTGLTANVYVPARNNWTDADKKDFGGTLTYKNLYAFKTNDIYDTEDISGSGEMMVPEDWELDYNADAYSSEGAFLRYEIVSGNLDIDLEDPQINAYLTEDVEINVYYHYTGTEDDVIPLAFDSTCPFTVTKNGEPASEGLDSTDDYCFTNGLIISGDGLTVAQPDAEAFDTTVAVFKDGLTVTLDSLNLSGENTYLSALYENTTWNLIGESRFENTTYPTFIGAKTTMITGSGSLYITCDTDEAAIFLGMPAFLQNCTVLGSAEANADPADLAPVEVVSAEDGGTVHFFAKEGLCKTLSIQPSADD